MTENTPAQLPCETRVLDGRYRVRRLIGRGQVADVYLGDDLLLERAVAIKIPHASSVDTAARLEEFRQEAVSLAAVRSPNVVSVYDVGVTDGGAYLVMQHIEGHTIQEEIRRFGPMGHTRTAAALAQLLSGLAAMHNRGLAHGDIRSSNVLLAQNGKVVLLDLGIVLDIRRSLSTESGKGASPDPAREAPSARALTCDVHAVGLLMLLMLTGVDPSRRAQRAGLEDLYRRLPPALAGVARCALDPDPAGRFPSAAVMKTAVESALEVLTSTGCGSSSDRASSRRRPDALDSIATTTMPASQLQSLLVAGTSSPRSVAEAPNAHRAGTEDGGSDDLVFFVDEK